MSLTALSAEDPSDNRRQHREIQASIHAPSAPLTHRPLGFCCPGVLPLPSQPWAALSSLLLTTRFPDVTHAPSQASSLPPHLLPNHQSGERPLLGAEVRLIPPARDKGLRCPSTCCRESDPPWPVGEAHTSHISITGWTRGRRWAEFKCLKHFIILSNLLNLFLEAVIF